MPASQTNPAQLSAGAPTTADDFLPIYDVSDGVATVVLADAATTWEALVAADLIELGRQKPLVGLLGAVRALPAFADQLLRGKKPAKLPERLSLEDMTRLPPEDGRWVLLAKQPGRALGLGLVGKFWLPVIQFATVTPEEFVDFNAPGYARTLYLLTIRPLDGNRCLLEALMRTSTTDERARRWFRSYWTLGVGSGAHVLVNGLLDVVRKDAERRAREAEGKGER
jgi:hypothetical protein